MIAILIPFMVTSLALPVNLQQVLAVKIQSALSFFVCVTFTVFSERPEVHRPGFRC